MEWFQSYAAEVELYCSLFRTILLFHFRWQLALWVIGFWQTIGETAFLTPSIEASISKGTALFLWFKKEKSEGLLWVVMRWYLNIGLLYSLWEYYKHFLYDLSLSFILLLASESLSPYLYLILSNQVKQRNGLSDFFRFLGQLQENSRKEAILLIEQFTQSGIMLSSLL